MALWHRFFGKQKLLALGAYPETGLADAREKHALAHKQVANGIDPSEAKKDAKRTAMLNAENSFEFVGRDWHDTKRTGWELRYAGFILNRMEADIFPKLGSRPINDISAPNFYPSYD